MQMTAESIRLCIKRKDNPKNSRLLYLHHKGFNTIDCLQEYTKLEVLFLESNALHKIENLEAQHLLHTLHLQNNKIERIENLEQCSNLKYLDLTGNRIRCIENLSGLPRLETLIVSKDPKNLLSKASDLRDIASLKLRELDLSSNKLNCPLADVLNILPCKLRVLSMRGNALCASGHYRKLVVSKNHALLSLDKRDICSEERQCCAAWGCAVDGGGSFDDADAAGRRALQEIKTKRMKTNAKKRSEIFSDSSSRHWSGSRVMGIIKGSIGCSREVEQLRKVVEDQRLEINRLKDQMTKSEPTTGPIGEGENWDRSCDTDSADSEQDCGYSLEDNQRMAERANAKLVARLERDDALRRLEGRSTQSKTRQEGGKSSDLSRAVCCSKSAGLENIDTFSLKPPLPPKV